MKELTITRDDMISAVRNVIREYGYIDIGGTPDDVEETGDELWIALLRLKGKDEPDEVYGATRVGDTIVFDTAVSVRNGDCMEISHGPEPKVMVWRKKDG